MARKLLSLAWRGPHYPAPVAAVESMQQGARKTRSEALAIEGALFS